MRQRRSLRVCVTLMTVLIMVVDPASAGLFSRMFGGCGSSCGGGYSSCGGGYYYGGGYCGGSYGSSCGYSSGCGSYYYGSSCCGGCGSYSCGGGCHASYSYSSCGSGCHDSCGSSCYDDCGCGHDSCGCDACGCGSCDSCCGGSYVDDGCGCGGVVSDGCVDGGYATSYDSGCSTCASGGEVIYGDGGYVDGGYVESYDSGCSTCASGGEVIYGDSYSTESYDDGGVVYEAPADTGSGTRSAPADAPSSAPTPADEGSVGGEDMFDDPPAPDDSGDDNMFDDGGTDSSGDDMDDLFPASVQMRIWRDNSGQFSTRAKLVELSDVSVRLLKENGRHCTVPFHRLSKADFHLVQRVAAAQGKTIPLRLASR